MTENDPHFFDQENLTQIGLVLSNESYRNLISELKHLKNNPPVRDISLNYVPNCLSECKKQLKKMQERYTWVRRIGFMHEIIERDLRKQNRALIQENQEFKDKNKELKKEVKRAYNHLHTALGIKKLPKENKDTAKNSEEKKKNKKRGAPKGHTGRTRPIPDKIDTTTDVNPPCNCPHCGGSHISAEQIYISKYIEDIPPVLKIVEEMRYKWGTCNSCNQKVINPEALQGPPVRIGNNLISLLSILRQQAGISYRKLSRVCSESFNIQLSPSGVLGIISRVSDKVKPVYSGIEAELRNQEVLNGDESGWKVDGETSYLWCFCNNQMTYYHINSSRGSKVPKAILGEDFQGIVHADFYAAYNFLSKTQRCLVHYLRSIREELEVSSDDKSLKQLKLGIKEIIEIGEKIKILPDSKKKHKKRKALTQKLKSLSKLKSKNKKTMTLISRIERYKGSFLRFADHPDVEFHNNRAERAIRPAVIFRKISFGNRSWSGAENHTALNTVFETVRQKKKNLHDFVKSILATPEDQVHKITGEILNSS